MPLSGQQRSNICPLCPRPQLVEDSLAWRTFVPDGFQTGLSIGLPSLLKLRPRSIPHGAPSGGLGRACLFWMACAELVKAHTIKTKWTVACPLLLVTHYEILPPPLESVRRRLKTETPVSTLRLSHCRCLWLQPCLGSQQDPKSKSLSSTCPLTLHKDSRPKSLGRRNKP